MVFLNLRQRADSVQALLLVEPEKISKQMVKWAAGLADESIVRVEGVVKKAPEPIKSASVSDVEVHVKKARRKHSARVLRFLTHSLHSYT
jgi:aspartyl-tRNA synthetase